MRRLETLNVGRSVCLLAKDVEAFEGVLLAAFPDLRFLWMDAARHTNLTKADGNPADGGWPVFGAVPYVESLHQEEDGCTRAWRESPGWQPIWGRTEYSGRNDIILNNPERTFNYRRGYIRARMNVRRPELIFFEEGMLWGRHAHEDKEQKAFLQKVIRLLGKVATNKLAMFARGSRTELIPAKPCHIWAGYHAIEWSRRHPYHVLGTFGCRPLEEVETGLPPLPEE